jgi:thiosulfate dehydrogenase
MTNPRLVAGLAAFQTLRDPQPEFSTPLTASSKRCTNPRGLFYTRPRFLSRRWSVKSFWTGFVLGVALLAGGVYYYFVSGRAPVATADPPIPFEKMLASKALNARIEKQHLPPPPVDASEANLLAGAQVYKEQCAVCHGLPNQPKTVLQEGMYPVPTELFHGKGVTDDPPSESYWKVANGIRLSGMPSFKSKLTDTQMWQVAQLVAHANELPDSAKKVLVPDTPPPTPEPAATPAPPSKRK